MTSRFPVASPPSYLSCLLPLKLRCQTLLDGAPEAGLGGVSATARQMQAFPNLKQGLLLLLDPPSFLFSPLPWLRCVENEIKILQTATAQQPGSSPGPAFPGIPPRSVTHGSGMREELNRDLFGAAQAFVSFILSMETLLRARRGPRPRRLHFF